jgi:hypothetical protein
MGGDTAIGGSEVVAVMSRIGESKGRFGYKLLATSKTSTMEKELQEAAPVRQDAFCSLDSANDRTRRDGIAPKRAAGHLRESPCLGRAPWH